MPPRTTINRNADVLNISVKVADNLISKVEDAITELTIKREQIAEDLQTKYDAYMAVKSIDDKLIEMLAEENSTLETLIHWKTNTNPNKRVKVFTKISNTVGHKAKETSEKIRWSKLVVEVLEKHQKFMSFDNLFNQVVNDNPKLKIRTDKTYKYSTKYYLVKFSNSKKSTIVIYKDLIGLKPWVKDGVVIPQHLNEFM